MSDLTAQCSAKINAFLCIHGRQNDGFHALTSLVLQLKFGDSLTLRQAIGDRSEDTLSGNIRDLGDPRENLILRAAQAFRSRFREAPPFHFALEKRIPVGAGLGGGSSNASAALRLMNDYCGEPLAEDTLHQLAATLGSDCPLFLRSGPVVMRGRGEQLSELSQADSANLVSRPVLLFKPSFSINTGSAYNALAKAQAYSNKTKATELLQRWCHLSKNQQIESAMLHNDFEQITLSKFIALDLTLKALRDQLGLPALLSGSGSACFCLPETDAQAEQAAETVKSMLGSRVFCIATSFRP